MDWAIFWGAVGGIAGAVSILLTLFLEWPKVKERVSESASIASFSFKPLKHLLHILALMSAIIGFLIFVFPDFMLPYTGLDRPDLFELATVLFVGIPVAIVTGENLVNLKRQNGKSSILLWVSIGLGIGTIFLLFIFIVS